MEELVNAVVEHIAAGKILLLPGEFDESEKHFATALEMAKELKSPKYEIQSLVGYVELYSEQENYDEARCYLAEAKQRLNDSGVDSEKFGVLIVEYDIFSATGKSEVLSELMLEESLPERLHLRIKSCFHYMSVMQC